MFLIINHLIFFYNLSLFFYLKKNKIKKKRDRKLNKLIFSIYIKYLIFEKNKKIMTNRTNENDKQLY